MTEINFIKDKCVFNKPQREWISSEDVYLSKIRQEVMRTREEHKDMYLPEVIDMLLKHKPPKKCEK